MELIAPIFVTLLAEIVKRVSAKLGKELTENIVKLLVLVIAVVAAYVIQKGIISIDLIKEIGVILTIAVGYYQIGYKWIIEPIITKITNK